MNETDSTSILPHYQPVGSAAMVPKYKAPLGSSVLPKYTPIGEVEIEVGPVEDFETIEEQKKREEKYKQAIIGGSLFFTGLALGFILGGITAPAGSL